MEYLTVDGGFTKIYNYNFAILNHFRHGAKIYLPLYLASSLNESLADHVKKPSFYPLAHQGLILLIYEYIKDKTMATKDGPLIINSHTSEKCIDSDSTGEPSTPTHKKRKVEIMQEEKDVLADEEEGKNKETISEMEINKEENYGEGEEGGNSENRQPNPEGSKTEKEALKPKEGENPNVEEME